MGKSTKKSIAVITGIFGDYDDVPPIPEGFDDAVLVSDKTIDSAWRNIVIDKCKSPRLTSKIPKFHPERFTACESSVWVDASMRDDRNWLKTAAEKKLMSYDLVLFKHPQRSTILSELIASLELDKYLDQPLVEQVHHYQLDGFRDNEGLWAGGVIARNHTMKNALLGDFWFLENQNWSIQDQLSFPYVVWKLQLEVGTFDEDQYVGPLKWIQHKGELQESINIQKTIKRKKNAKIKTAMRLFRERKYSQIWFLLRRYLSFILVGLRIKK